MIGDTQGDDEQQAERDERDEADQSEYKLPFTD